MPLVLFNPQKGPLGATTPAQSGPRRNDNEGVLRIVRTPCITGTSPSDCLVSYQDTHWGVLPPAEVQLVYSTTPADWAMYFWWTLDE